MASPAGQPDELVHPAGQQRQPEPLDPGDAVTVSVAIGETIRVVTVLPFASQRGDEKQESRLGQEHIEHLDRQSVLTRRRENAGVVRDDAGERLAVPQTNHDLPGGEAGGIRMESPDSQSSVGGNACVAGQQDALVRGRTRAATAPTLPEGSYRNQFWIEDPRSRSLICRGVFGQMIHISWEQRMVVVKLSTYPDFLNSAYSVATLKAVHAIAAALA